MQKIDLARLPTPVARLQAPPEGTSLWIKRDDQTGTELMGNKVRKLEYALREALDRGADTVVTCGGIQSNHARATVAACAKLGLSCVLLLKDDGRRTNTGNYFLDRLFGATVRFVDAKVYDADLSSRCEEEMQHLQQAGRRPYFIPVGASNGIGTFGYVEAFREILRQEKEIGVRFDAIVTAVGSGGTYAGLCFANVLAGEERRIIGIPVARDAAYFTGVIRDLWDAFTAYAPAGASLPTEQIRFIDGWTGEGYACTSPEDYAFIRTFARQEGIVLDPVYTGKAMRGLYASLQNGHPQLADVRNLLFIHTGGLPGIFGREDEFGR